MRKQIVLLVAFSAAIFFGGSGKAVAQFSRSAAIELSAQGYGSGSGSFEYNPTSRRFGISGDFFSYSGYGFGGYSRVSDNRIAVGAFNLITTYGILTVPAFSMGRDGSSYFGSFYSSLLGETVFVLISGLSLKSALQRRGLSNRRTLSADLTYPSGKSEKGITKPKMELFFKKA